MLLTCAFCYLGDTANSLGNAMDELMRHQPSLRTGATTAIIKVGEVLRKLLEFLIFLFLIMKNAIKFYCNA
jgi:hypothetical protein